MNLDRALHHLPMPAALTSAIGDGAWLVTAANAAFTAAFGRHARIEGADLRRVLDAPFDGVTAAEAEDVVELPGSRTEANCTRHPVAVTVVPLKLRDPARSHVVYVRDWSTQEVEERVLKAHEWFRSVYRLTPDINFFLDREGRLTEINPAGERALGFSRADLMRGGYEQRVHESQLPLAKGIFARLLEREAQRFELALTHSDGQVRDLDMLAFPIVDQDTVTAVFVQARDITERKAADRRLQDSQQRYRALFEHHVDSVVSFDIDGSYEYLNPATEALTGFSADVLRKLTAFQLVLPELREDAHREFARASAGETRQYETAMRNRAGDVVDLHITLIPIVIDGETRGIHCVAKNITEQKRLERELSAMAFTDALTGLGNRNAAADDIARRVAEGRPFAVIAMDLDRLKSVNDTWGRDTGDMLLTSIAQRLTHRLAGRATVYRYAGDEFVLTLDSGDPHHATSTAEDLREMVRTPLMLGEHEVTISATIGISIYPDDGYDAETQMRNVETALYGAKRRGLNQVALYRSVATPDDERRVQIELELRRALQRDELSVVYQPQVSLETGELHGAEALMRWNSATLGAVPPDTFIPVAEDTGLIGEMGRWVIETACRQLAAWAGRGWDITVSVNISMSQFDDDGFVEHLRHTLEATGVDPHMLVLEITESIASRVDIAVARLHQLRDLGVQIAIDDFGTGYSSLQYLRDFPLDYLKIDRCFVSQSAHSPRDRDLVATIATLARNFGLRTVAEGVESEADADLLADLGADLAQGYHFSRPLDPASFEAWVEAHLAVFPQA